MDGGGHQLPSVFQPLPQMLSQGDVASLFFLPCWRPGPPPLGVPSPLGCAASLTHCGTGPNLRASPAALSPGEATSGPEGRGSEQPQWVCPGPRSNPPPPSRNQLPKHSACGPLTPWLPGLEEGPLSHETSIRCPLIGTQSACSSLERAGHKLEETTPRPGGAVHRGPRRGLGAQGRQTLLRGSVARKDGEEAAGGAMGPGDGR